MCEGMDVRNYKIDHDVNITGYISKMQSLENLYEVMQTNT
jgi:hypothetical protein